MYIKQFYVGGISHLSYLLAGSEQCAIIDPIRDIGMYLDEAEKMGYKITHIIETHLHADFISGHMDLARAAGAEIIGPESAKMKFEHISVSEGDEIRIENLKIRVLETPGHTPEHVSYVVTDTRRGDEPCCIFCGDTLFVGDVGRPDLFPGIAHELAEKLFNSLKKIFSLPDFVEVYPAHAAGSLCGKALSAKRSSTIGFERLYNKSVRLDNLQDFKSNLLRDMPDAPDHFRRCSAVNRFGPAFVSDLSEVRPMTPDIFKSKTGNDSVILDVRGAEAFAGLHIPGSINIDRMGNFATFAGWILPEDRDIYIVADSGDEMKKAVTELRRVGLDNVKGWLKGGIGAWASAGMAVDYIPQLGADEVIKLCRDQGGGYKIVDVRSPGEFRNGHMANAVNIPVADIRIRFGEVAEGKKAVVCSSGFRSAMAASILKKNGIGGIWNVPGGMSALINAGYGAKCPLYKNIHGPGI